MGADVAIDLRFFQAAATVIPTLFVAWVVGARSLHQSEDHDDAPAESSTQWDRLGAAFSQLGVVGLLGLAELGALQAVAAGGGDASLARLIIAAIVALAGLIVIAMLGPRWDAMGIGHTSQVLLRTVILPTAIPAAWLWSAAVASHYA